MVVGRFLNSRYSIIKIVYGNVEKKLYGIHWIASFSGCGGRDSSGKLLIDDADGLCDLISKGLEDIGANIFSRSTKQFEPQGATVLVGITESHASAHSWPEDKFMEFDFNTCNTNMDGDLLLDYIGNGIGASKVFYSKILRYGDSDEVVERGNIVYE